MEYLWGRLGGTETLFFFHNKVTTSVGDCLDQGGVLRI